MPIKTQPRHRKGKMYSGSASKVDLNQKKKPIRNLAAPEHSNDHHHTHHTINAVYVYGSTKPLVPEDVDYIDYRNFKFDPLEELSSLQFQTYCGPTPESNWVIPGKLLVGAYPASKDDNETSFLLNSILKYGINRFVCLQQEYQSGVTEEMWRNGAALRPYFEDVRDVMLDVENNDVVKYFHEEGDCNLPLAESVSFVHFPIKDCGITDDDRVIELSKSLVHSLATGDKMYLHCWGGHGRTGTIVSIMLHLMYNLSAKEAMARCQKVHDMREYPVEVGSPQTQQQRDQVIRVIKKLSSSSNMSSPIGSFFQSFLSPGGTNISVSKSNLIPQGSTRSVKLFEIENKTSNEQTGQNLSAEKVLSNSKDSQISADKSLTPTELIDLPKNTDFTFEKDEFPSLISESNLMEIDEIMTSEGNNDVGIKSLNEPDQEFMGAGEMKKVDETDNVRQKLPRLKVENLGKAIQKGHSKENITRPISPTAKQTQNQSVSRIRNRMSYPLPQESPTSGKSFSKFISGSPRPVSVSARPASLSPRAPANRTNASTLKPAVVKDVSSPRKSSLSSSIRTPVESKPKVSLASSPMPPPHGNRASSSSRGLRRQVVAAPAPSKQAIKK